MHTTSICVYVCVYCVCVTVYMCVYVSVRMCVGTHTRMCVCVCVLFKCHGFVHVVCVECFKVGLKA